MPADYHHLPKVLDLIAALKPAHAIEICDDEGLYTPLIKKYFPSIDLSRKRADLAIFHVLGKDSHPTLEQIRTLIKTHRGIIVVAPKLGWDKSDLAGIGPTLFVHDATLIVAYLGNSSDIKKLRKELLRNRVRRQLKGASMGRRGR
ncbi:MAG: hypothetical protein WCK01_00030 [Candidatus Uhrbacteria bacterium]